MPIPLAVFHLPDPYPGNRGCLLVLLPLVPLHGAKTLDLVLDEPAFPLILHVVPHLPEAVGLVLAVDRTRVASLEPLPCEDRKADVALPQADKLFVSLKLHHYSLAACRELFVVLWERRWCTDEKSLEAALLHEIGPASVAHELHVLCNHRLAVEEG